MMACCRAARRHRRRVRRRRARPTSRRSSAALITDEVLVGRPKRALDGLEVGAIDVDGDGKADVVATYGCNAWGDGSCQSHGQFFLVRRGARWVEIE